jgi:cell division protein FtsQ
MTGSRTSARRPAPATVLFAERRTRRRRLRGILHGLAAVLAVAAVGGAVWLVGWSDATKLETIRVEGADGPLVDQVLAAAAAPVGSPLLRVDTTALAKRVGELPEISSVSVERSWPQTIVVTVTPRTAGAAIDADGTWWLVDESGVLFGRSNAQPADLPVLDAPVADGDEATRAAGVAVLSSLPAALNELVATVSAQSEADVRLGLTSGATVLWGDASMGDRKADVLLALLREGATTYDVSAPERPAITP